MKEQVTDVFFDLDHTLWDFERNSALTFQKIFELHKIEVSLEAFLQVYAPLNFQYWKLYREERIGKEELRYQRLKKSMDKLSYKISDVTINKLSEDYINYLPTNNFLFPGAIEILKYLQPTYKLHIITNGFRDVQRLKMKSSNIFGYFTHVVDSESVGVKKPNPRIFDFALTKAEVAPKNSVMIGDSLEADIQGAKQVGMHTIYFEPNKDRLRATSHINKLFQIKEYL